MMNEESLPQNEAIIPDASHRSFFSELHASGRRCGTTRRDGNGARYRDIVMTGHKCFTDRSLSPSHASNLPAYHSLLASSILVHGLVTENDCVGGASRVRCKRP